ncbi:MAG: Mur ligase family protein, partial [Tumebacillaceae bacterium]
MEEIGSQTWLAWVACKAVKGTLPDKIRRVVDRPSDLRADQDVLFDRWKQVGTRSVSAYGRYVLVTEDPQVYERASADGAVLLVDDIDAAYWRFVRHYREQFQIPVFAVTGTCGKTTTKEMIKQILSAKHRVQATVRSKNAGSFHLGYLLGIDASTDVAVFETGVSKRGDLLEACDYYRPTVGVITNIGIDHLNAFHTLEAYIRAKEEILAGLTYQGTVVINGDDPNIATFDWSRYKGRVLTFGLGQLADFRAEEIRVADGGMAFTLRYQHMAHRLFVPGYGKHNVYNALAAIAAAYAIGVGIAEAGEVLRSYHHLQGHMNVLPGVKGSVVIDDTWNSNPTSMETALQVLCDLAGGRK